MRWRIPGGRQDFGRDLLSGSHQHRPLECVAQFADVAWKLVLLEYRLAAVVEPGIYFVLPIELSQQKSGQLKQFVPPLPKRRNANGDQVQTEEQVLTERLAGRQPGPAGYWRARQSWRVQFDAFRSSEPVKLFRLDDVEQLGLNRSGRYFAISSRMTVPPCARSSLPSLEEMAPVKAPRS